MDYKKYVIVFFITAALFGSAVYASNYINNKKIDSLKSIEDKVSIDILSSETQFTLLEESSCADADSSSLADELSSLGEKIAASEQNIGSDDVLSLKRYYSLLEIKDYLLAKRISARCGTKALVVLYFYSNETDCADCAKQSDVLTELRDKYPGVRVYSFDYNLDLNAVHTLTKIYHVSATPSLVINDRTYTGLQDLPVIEKNTPLLRAFLPKPEAKKVTPSLVK